MCLIEFGSITVGRHVKDVFGSLTHCLLTGDGIRNFFGQGTDQTIAELEIIACHCGAVDVFCDTSHDAVCDHGAFKAPLVAKNGVQQGSAFRGRRSADSVERGHDAGCTAALDSDLESLEIDLAECLLVEPCRKTAVVTVGLLVIDREVLEIAVYAGFLDAPLLRVHRPGPSHKPGPHAMSVPAWPGWCTCCP